MDAAAMGTPIRQGTMLADLQGRLHDLDLLDDAGQLVGGHDRMMAIRAGTHVVSMATRGELFGGKRGTFVFGVARLSPAQAGGAIRGSGGLGRLDDVRRGRLGGSRRNRYLPPGGVVEVL